MKDSTRIIRKIIGLQENINHLLLTYKIDNWVRLDLSIDQLKSLIIIYCEGKISYKDLARALGISRSNITGLADRLIQNGLVTRNQDTQDRRVQNLILTDKGIKMLDNTRQQINSNVTKILATLETDELNALDNGLSAFMKSAEKNISLHSKDKKTGQTAQNKSA